MPKIKGGNRQICNDRMKRLKLKNEYYFYTSYPVGIRFFQE